jgi:hypothetical protein
MPLAAASLSVSTFATRPPVAASKPNRLAALLLRAPACADPGCQIQTECHAAPERGCPPYVPQGEVEANRVHPLSPPVARHSYTTQQISGTLISREDIAGAQRQGGASMPRCSPSPDAQLMTMGPPRWPISPAHHAHNHLQVDGRRLVESDRGEHRAAEGKRLRAVLRPLEARRGFLSTAAEDYGPIEWAKLPKMHSILDAVCQPARRASLGVRSELWQLGLERGGFPSRS